MAVAPPLIFYGGFCGFLLRGDRKSEHWMGLIMYRVSSSQAGGSIASGFYYLFISYHGQISKRGYLILLFR
jgi:hypothetical protein